MMELCLVYAPSAAPWDGELLLFLERVRGSFSAKEVQEMMTAEYPNDAARDFQYHLDVSAQRAQSVRDVIATGDAVRVDDRGDDKTMTEEQWRVNYEINYPNKDHLGV